ncbi:MAG: S9 family peptidase [Chlorobi bacterium]|nr:S9 family peptidase [Chlorobiota bacterium]
MKKYLFVALVSVFILKTNAYSQEKLLTIKDAVIGNNRHMYPKYLHQLSWMPNSDNFTYVENNEIIEENVENSKKKTVFDLEKLNKILSKSGFENFDKLPSFKWQDKNLIRFTNDTNILFVNIKSKKIEYIIKHTGKAENIDFCKQNNSIAYTVDNNLFIVDLNENVYTVTNDTNKDIVNGGSYVHRDEFGIYKGTFWSPKGNYLAFYHEDMSMVTNYPLVNITTRIATVDNIKYPMAGMKSEEVKVGVYNLKTGKTIYLNTGEPVEQYLTNIAWSPDEKTIYIAVLNREQNHLKLNKYDAITGKFIKTLFEEKDDKYVEPEKPVRFLPQSDSVFVWFSERDGYNHIYLYNIEGNLIKQLTKGDWEVTKLLGFDEVGNYMYFVSNERSPIERDVYKINISSGDKTLLTDGKGTHTPKFNSNYTYFIDQYSSLDVPRDYYLVNNNARKIREIYSAENPFKDYKLGALSLFKLKSADGKTDLYARMIKPVDFNPNKKYPVIVYVYGGPHSQLVRNTWMGNSRIWQYYMAQKGYVTLTLDNRGTSYRGHEFESAIHRHLGNIEVADQKMGIDYLFSKSYVDTNRIGVHGWSYGGFMAISLMQKYNNIFKVGVAGGPVIDWKYYEVMYGERYMDTPQENPEGYKNSRLEDKVTNLKGKLLIIHGAIDGTVVWQNSLTYIENCIENGIPVDYFVYPRHEHNVRGKDRIHLMKKVTQYFDDYL